MTALPTPLPAQFGCNREAGRIEVCAEKRDKNGFEG